MGTGENKYKNNVTESTSSIFDRPVKNSKQSGSIFIKETEGSNIKDVDGEKVSTDKIKENAEKVDECKPEVKSADNMEVGDLNGIKEKKEDVDQSDADTIFKRSCHLYLYSNKTKVIEERGDGNAYIKKVPEKQLYKLVMVRNKLCKLGCNHFIFPVGKLYKHKKKNTFIWMSKSDRCDDDKENMERTFIIRFDKDDDAVLFEEKYKYAIDENVKVLREINMHK